MWSTSLAILLSVGIVGLSSASAQGVRVIERDYSIALSADWAEVQSDDPEQRSFDSRTRDAHLVVSSLSMDAPGARLEEIAHRFVQFRLDGENRAAEQFGLHMTIVEPIVVARPYGFAIAYYGSDDSNRQFSFAGVVTRRQVLSVYVESGSLSEQAVKGVLDEIIEGLSFDRSP
jgi:hypothetical protein